MDKNIEVSQRIAKEVFALGGRAYYVGGCVRDELCGIKSKDIDIEVHGITPQNLEKILDSVGKRIEIGKSFGIYNLKGYSIDIAMPRKEKKTGMGHRDFAVDIDPFIGAKEAAKRRDFTVNAIMKDIVTSEILDFFGGREDLGKKIIRHVNTESFSEDPLRVLRGAQFAARFKYAIAKDTLNLCREIDISHLSKERIMGETEKALIKAATPSVFFEVLKKMNKLKPWFCEVSELCGIMQNPDFHAEGDVWAHTMLTLDEAAKIRINALHPLEFMMSALVHDFGKVDTTRFENGKIRSINHEIVGLSRAEKFISRITNEESLKKYVLNMTELHMRPNMLIGAKSSQKAINKLFDKSICPHDLILLAAADSRASICIKEKEDTQAVLFKHLAVFEEYMQRPYVTGSDLVAAGLTPNKNFSEILAHAHKLRLAGVPKKSALADTLSFAKQKELLL